MANYFIRNYQNDRLELHFERSFYLALAESIKQSIRASFYFDKKIPAWLSKTKLSQGKGVFVPDYLELADYGVKEKDNSASAATPKPIPKPKPAEPTTYVPKPNRKNVPMLADYDYLSAYKRVAHLVDAKTRLAHDYYSLETDGFTNFTRVYTEKDIAADWTRHKQDVAGTRQTVNEDNGINDGYSGQGRKFVGRSQKQTANLDITELAKLVRLELAATYPDAKFSVKISRFSMGQSMDVTILSVPFDPFSDTFIRYLKETTKAYDYNNWIDRTFGHPEYNQYNSNYPTYNQRFEKLREKVKSIAQQYNFDNSDPMTDYSHVRYYSSISVEQTNYIRQYYPNSPEVKQVDEQNTHYATKKAEYAKRVAKDKGKFPKGSVVFYTLATGRPERKGYLADGKYLAGVIKSPNGQASYSSYTIALLKPITDLDELEAMRIRKMDVKYRKYFLFNYQGREYVRKNSSYLLERVGEHSLSAAEDSITVRSSAPAPAPKPLPASAKSAPQPNTALTAVSNSKRADAFLKTAESMQKEADKKFNELEHAQVNTPKRLKEANSKRIDADVLADKATYYRAIGKAVQAGTLPPILAGIGPARADNDLSLFIAGFAGGGGYYDAYRADKVNFQQAQSDYQIKAILRVAEKIKLYSMADVEAAYQALQSISGSAPKVDAGKATLQKLIDNWRFTNQPGFFPTPKAVGEDLVKQAGIEPGDTIYEPSAGLGDLAKVIRDKHPDNPLEVGEVMHSLREILKLEGFSLTGEDMLDTRKQYDKIVMNPPFENGQDIDHVRHAYSLLKPGGRVVSIMGEGAFHGNQKKSRSFLEWLEDVGGTYTERLEGLFKSAFRSTGVATRTVVIDKPGESGVDSPTTDANRERAKAKLRLLSLKLQLLTL